MLVDWLTRTWLSNRLHEVRPRIPGGRIHLPQSMIDPTTATISGLASSFSARNSYLTWRNPSLQ